MKSLNRAGWLSAGDPGQPVLLLLHGFMGSGRDWLPFLPSLSAHFYCLCPDLPGHGQNRDVQLHFAEIAPSLLAALDQMGIPSFHLLGYSLGGRLALSVLAHAPARLQRLILESSFPGFRAEADRQARRLADQAQAKSIRSDYPAFLNHWYHLPLWGDLSDSLGFADLLQGRLSNDPQALAQFLLLAGAAEQPDYWPLLRDLRSPCLYLVGEQDTKYLSFAREIAGLNPHIHCQELAGGHNLHAQSPVAWLKTVLNFLMSKQS